MSRPPRHQTCPPPLETPREDRAPPARAARSVGPATVRQQATAIYRKASVEGRHDLSAFFLEDLLTPRPPSPPTN